MTGKENPMAADDGSTLKLIKGGAHGSPTRTVRLRTTRRRSVTRRTPERDPVAEVLEHLDEEPVEEPAAEPAVKRAERLRAGWARRTAEQVEEERVDDVDADTVEETDADADDDADAKPITRTTAKRARRPAATRRPAQPRRRPVQKRRRWSGRPDRITAMLLAVLCLALAAAIVFAGRWYGDRQLDRAHQQAIAAAKQTTVDFVSVSAGSVDRDLQRIVAGSTGDFRDEFSRGQSQVRAAIVENNVDSRGTVLRAALVSGDTKHAVVLVAVDATVKNTKAPEGRQSHYRIQVELNRSGSGRWLVSRLQFVG
jgi:Mce-associated membrane protein